MYTIKQAAKHLNVHWQTIRNYIQKGYIKPIKHGRTIRIPKEELEKVKDENEKREVELRFILKDKLETENQVREMGAKLTNHSHIIDHYYCDSSIKSLHENNEFYESPLGYMTRIREFDNDYSGKVITTLEIKKLAGPDFNDHSNCLEAEIDVKDFKSADRLLHYMNKKKLITIDKERFVYRLDETKLCFDSIKDWGDGLEIELMTEQETKKIYDRLWKVAEKLNLTEEDQPQASFTYEIMKEMAKF